MSPLSVFRGRNFTDRLGGGSTSVATESKSFRDAIDDYLLDCRRRGLRPATIDYYQTALERFARKTRLQDIAGFDRQAVRAYQDASSTLSAGSMRGYLRAMRTFST